MYTKFIFIPTSNTFCHEMMSNIFRIAKAFGILNSLIVYAQDGHVQSANDNFFFRNFSAHPEETDPEVLFPDKLKDMNGYTFKILIGDQTPRIMCEDGLCDGIDVAVMRIIAEKHNAAVALDLIQTRTEDSRAIFSKRLNTGQVDLSVLTKMEILNKNKFWRTIITYDESGFCAMIPLPDRLSFLEYLLSPFDLWSWISMLLVIAASAIVWKIIRRQGSVSALSFVYGIAASFVGQDIPFLNISRTQTAILQLCFAMTFIMGNAYQSLIIASMMISREGIRFKSFEELFASDAKLLVTQDYLLRFNATEDPRVIKNMIAATNLTYDALLQGAITGRCDMLHHDFNSRKSRDLADEYYMLPDQIQPFYEHFFLAISSPFYDMLQTSFDLVFESGIRQYLKSQFETREIMGVTQAREVDFIQKEKYFLVWSDVDGVFLIFTTGYFIALVSFLMEVGWYFLSKNWRKIMNRVARIKRYISTFKLKKGRVLRKQPNIGQRLGVEP